MNFRSLWSVRTFRGACRAIWHDACLLSQPCAKRHVQDDRSYVVAEFARIQPTRHLASEVWRLQLRSHKSRTNLTTTLPGSDECPHWLERSIPPGLRP